MPCYSPLEGFHCPKGGISFSRSKSTGLRMTVPCGQCVGCRLERSRQWAVRCMHEASLHAENCFITLTYSDGHLPPYGSLVKKHFQDFMKRLRRGKNGRVRYFHCGEYGSVNRRPHYHALLFGHDFVDKVPWRKAGDHQVFRSSALESTWKFGHAEIGSATFESAAYVARYCVKTLQNLRFREGSRESYLEAVEREYSRCDTVTGEIVQVAPEYVTMSRRPGIGAGWFDKFSAEVYPSDEVIVRGKSTRPPRFYDKLCEDEGNFDEVAAGRAKARRKAEETPDRLAVRGAVAEARLTLYGERTEL